MKYINFVCQTRWIWMDVLGVLVRNQAAGKRGEIVQVVKSRQSSCYGSNIPKFQRGEGEERGLGSSEESILKTGLLVVVVVLVFGVCGGGDGLRCSIIFQMRRSQE